MPWAAGVLALGPFQRGVVTRVTRSMVKARSRWGKLAAAVSPCRPPPRNGARLDEIGPGGIEARPGASRPRTRMAGEFHATNPPASARLSPPCTRLAVLVHGRRSEIGRPASWLPAGHGVSGRTIKALCWWVPVRSPTRSTSVPRQSPWPCSESGRRSTAFPHGMGLDRLPGVVQPHQPHSRHP